MSEETLAIKDSSTETVPMDEGAAAPVAPELADDQPSATAAAPEAEDAPAVPDGADSASDEPTAETAPSDKDADPAADAIAKPEPPAPAPRAPEPEPVRQLRQAMDANDPVEGRVIGWNNGGFHVVVGGMTAFCPRSEIEIDAPKAPETYLDQELEFRVLKVQRGGKRIVLSRAAHLKNERRLVRKKVTQDLVAGSVRSGQVASITDFGAFVDLDGVQGLVHISELSRRRVEHPSEVVEVGQEVEVKILRVESGGRRISLSMKALEPDPWDGVEQKLEEGALVTGTVERTADFGAFIRLAPGLTGLLPTSAMGLPRGASAARRFTPGKEVPVQIQSVDRRRRRISLSLEGSTTEGSRKDFESFRREHSTDGGGFNALAAALEKARRDTV